MAKNENAAEQAVIVEPEAAPVAAPVEVEPAQPEDDGLVKVTKNGEVLAVNPACLGAHMALGWREVQE